MPTAGLVFTTTTIGGSSQWNSSGAGGGGTLSPPTPNGGYWAGSTYYPDIMRNPFNIGIGCTCSLGGLATTYNVEHSFDDYLTIPSTTMTWFPNSGITAASTNATGNYAFPVRAIRLNVTTAGSSTQTVTMTLIQAAGD
jgi:hypothetical protein